MAPNMADLAVDLIVFAATAFVSVWISDGSLTKNRSIGTSIATQALRDGSSLNNQEKVCTVTSDNQVLAGGHTRKDMRLSNLWHRATFCIVRCISQADSAEDIRLLVQKRSSQKDYCPGRFDAAPGGVVGCGETYRENAEREMQEEMGIDVTTNMKRLFTFPYQDSVVKVWGELFEVEFDGIVADLVLQESEVDEVVCMQLSEIQKSMTEKPQDWMPDSIHAIQLYHQYLQDKRTQRRFLRGYSSHIDSYQVRPKPKVIFFDCDDCLYFDNWTVAKLLTAKIDAWCVNIGLPQGRAYQLYKQYGTALRGLISEGFIEGEEAIDAFLEDVHDVGVDKHLKQDLHLRQLLFQMDPSIPKYVFTASVKHHAERCLQALGIDDLFVDIIDVKACNFHTKHSEHSFETAMRIANVEEPEACVFLDDSVTNIRAARNVGWRSILVGKVHRDTGTPVSAEDAEHEIDVIHDFPDVLPELFLDADQSINTMMIDGEESPLN